MEEVEPSVNEKTKLQYPDEALLLAHFRRLGLSGFRIKIESFEFLTKFPQKSIKFRIATLTEVVKTLFSEKIHIEDGVESKLKELFSYRSLKRLMKEMCLTTF